MNRWTRTNRPARPGGRWCLLAAGWLAVGVGLAATPAAAASYDSTTEALIRTLNRQLLYIAVPITLLVESILIYTVLRFRNNEVATPTHENRRLEITWTVATALVLVFVGVASYQVLASPAISGTPSELPDAPPNAVEVEVVGAQFFWTFEYPAANVTTTGTLVLPVDRPVYLRVTSRDVIHSVHVPALGIKQDAIPGQTNVVRTRITDTGSYQLYCAEYCGAAHSQMLATVRVVGEDEYRRWLQEQRASGGGGG